MKRRLTRSESREATQRAIMDAAESLFIEKGYRGASLDEIAETAGFSKGAVYSNFPSKGELFLALMDRRAEQDQASLAAPPAAPQDGGEFGWPLATLDFFIEAVRDPGMRTQLAQRYADARVRSGESMAEQHTAPAGISQTELATIAMALGSGLIIQASIDPGAVPPDLMGRVMSRLMANP